MKRAEQQVVEVPGRQGASLLTYTHTCTHFSHSHRQTAYRTPEPELRVGHRIG